MPRRQADVAVGIAAAVLLWAIAIVPAYSFFEWPRQIETLSLVGVLRIAAILGLVAGITWLPNPVVRLLLVIAVIWVVWCPATAWPLILGSMLPVCRGACAVCGWLFGAGRGGMPSWLGLAVLGLGLTSAVWRRPRARTADGAVERRTLTVRYVAILCLFLGPIGGLAAWLALAPGDIYGGPLGLGILIGLFGLLTFTGHAAFDGLFGRPGLSAAMAPLYAGVVILAPVALAAAAGNLRVTH